MMFDGPEYASYLALMQEIGLDWTWREGDWYWHEGAPGFGEFVRCIRDGLQVPDGAVPLPRLDQWLTMLEEVPAIERLYFETGPTATYQVAAQSASGRWLSSRYPTREESCARLWCAVTGRTVG